MDVNGHSLLMVFTSWFSVSFLAFIRKQWIQRPRNSC